MQLAKILGVPTRAAEDALHSESLAQAHLSRRNLLGGGLALLCTGTVSVDLLGAQLTQSVMIRGVDYRYISVSYVFSQYALFAVLSSPLLEEEQIHAHCIG